MATSNIAVTEGSGKNIATHSISEDAITKQIQRVGLVNSAGAETGIAALPLQVSLANTAANATPVLVDLGAADTLGTVTNLAQLGGQAITMGTGARAAGTPRVTIATDDVLATVTTVGTVTTCSTVTNLAQMGGVAIALNTGTRSTGTQRVTIATDDVLATVTNLAQLGGQAINMGTGARAAGTQRVTIATDDIVPCVGSIADDATTPGNPQMIGGSAVETDGTDPTSVSAEADVARCRTDRNRRLLVNVAHPNLWNTVASYVSAQTDVEIKATPGAGLSLYITDIIVSNGATAGTVQFEEATAGAKTKRTAILYMASNSVSSMQYMTPIRITPATNFGIVSTIVTTHSVDVHGYIAP
jgi:hypothetical protein